eukprot:313898-Prorocentrum_minimum.AAC.2
MPDNQGPHAGVSKGRLLHSRAFASRGRWDAPLDSPRAVQRVSSRMAATYITFLQGRLASFLTNCSSQTEVSAALLITAGSLRDPSCSTWGDSLTTRNLQHLLTKQVVPRPFCKTVQCLCTASIIGKPAKLAGTPQPFETAVMLDVTLVDLCHTNHTPGTVADALLLPLLPDVQTKLDMITETRNDGHPGGHHYQSPSPTLLIVIKQASCSHAPG